MDKHSKPTLAKLVHLVHTLVVKPDSLYIGMKLHSLEPERDYLINVSLHILAVLMESSKPRKSAAALGNRTRDKIIYARYLLWSGRYRLNYKMLYSRPLSVLEKSRYSSVKSCGQAVEMSRSIGCLPGYLVGIYMAM